MVSIFKRLTRLFTHPEAYFSDREVTIWDGVVVMVGLFAASFVQKLVWVEAGSQALSPLEALKQAAINSLLIWSLFCVFYFAIAGVFRRSVNLARLSGWVGAAGLPVVVTTCISAISWLIAGAFDLTPIYSAWMVLQTGLSWLGLALSWAGLFGYFLLKNSLQLRKLWSVLLPLIVFLFLVAGQVLPKLWHN
jgi:hypothetical protein